MNKLAIRCATESEFKRMISLYNLDDEYMDWDFFGADTVLLPFENQYGDVEGYVKENGYEIISSTIK